MVSFDLCLPVESKRYVFTFNTLAERIMISVRSLQRSEGYRRKVCKRQKEAFPPHKVYIFLIRITSRS